jgi:hypothetical protein
MADIACFEIAIFLKAKLSGLCAHRNQIGHNTGSVHFACNRRLVYDGGIDNESNTPCTSSMERNQGVCHQGDRNQRENNMKLVTFQDAEGTRVGVLTADGTGVVDLHKADASLPTEMVALLEGGDVALDKARTAAARGSAISLDSVKLLAPILRPGKITLAKSVP